MGRDSDYLDVVDIARMLGVTKRRVYDWLRQGDIPRPIRINRKTRRWPREAFKKWLEGTKRRR